MNVTVDNLGPCKRLVRIEVSADRVNATLDEAAGQFQKAAELPGFRPGKAPKHMIVRNFDSRISDQAKRRILEECFREAAREQKLSVLSVLNIEEQQFGRGVPFSFNVTCEITPEFEMPNYKGLAARREISTPSEADVQRATNILRDQQAKYNDVDREIRDGDVALIHYKGTIDGKPITEISPAARGLAEKRDFWVVVAKDSFIPGFTEQLIGARAAEKRNVQVTFAADFAVKELANRSAVFEVEVAGVKEKVLPEVNEEFAKSFGAGSLEELMEGIRRDLRNELNFQQKRSVRDQLVKQLLDQTQFDLPESVVNNETRELVYNIVNQNQQRGVPREALEEKKDEIYRSAQLSARERVKAGFLLNRIAESEKIQAEEKELIARIQAIAEQNNVTFDKMLKNLRENNRIGDVAQEIVTAKALDFLELNAKIDEVPVTRP